MCKIISAKSYDYNELFKVTKKLLKEYDFLKPINLGKSCFGREIKGLKIGNSCDYSLITAATHGSEYITETVLLMFIENLCSALKYDGSIAGFNAKKAMYNRGVIFVPCVNPDGVEIAINGAKGCGDRQAEINKICLGDFKHYNANFRGVDINHNFKAGWEDLHRLEQKEGIFGPSPTQYGGPYPESEPETAALTSLCKNEEIRHVVALHSQGEVIYWCYGEKRPPKSREIAEILATSSGYALDVPLGLANGGGFKDWFIECFDKPGFTIEMGLGKNPLPIEYAEKIYKQTEEMLMLCTIV